MGQTLSAPVTEKHSDEDSNKRYMYGSSCMQGWRVSMEDAHTTLLTLAQDPEAAFFAVFDGHGGQSAAKFAGLHLADRIHKDSAYSNGDYKVAIKSGFLGLDYDLKTDPDFLDDVSGCTAVCTLITKDKRIFCGNAGDSRAILSVNGTVKELSFDHKPQNTDEYARIYQAGGFVEYGRVNGNLALSRAIGDFEFKQNMRLPAEDQAVTANPDITEHQITEEDEFIVIACDGIWDCMTSQEVITFVRERIADGDSLKVVCEKLMENCLAPASDYGGLGCDNMTVVIVAILNDKTPEEWTNMMVSRVGETRTTRPADTSILDDECHDNASLYHDSDSNSLVNTEERRSDSVSESEASSESDSKEIVEKNDNEPAVETTQESSS